MIKRKSFIWHKYIYEYVNSLRKVKTTIGPLIDVEGCLISEPKSYDKYVQRSIFE